ncbi:hypothetical protein TNCV_4174001 [Trichonephila clavipes]|nr:hypothetical protein TNCV_4174001 [Trichonephila clavipes]
MVLKQATVIRKNPKVTIRVSLLGRCTLGSCQAANPVVRFVEREKRWEAPDLQKGVLPQNLREIKPNRIVPCMLLKAMDKDRRASTSLPRKLLWASI